MLALRWTLAVIAALVGGGFLLLNAWDSGFRRSFGASDTGPLIPLVLVIIFGALIASVVVPDQRWLLHSTAVIVVALTVACFWMFRGSPFLGTVGWLYLGAWLVFYWQTAWATAR